MYWKLTDHYRVTTIPRNYCLEELITIRPKDKPERQEWRILGYYSGLRSILKALPDYVGLREDVTTLEELTLRLEELAAAYENIGIPAMSAEIPA